MADGSSLVLIKIMRIAILVFLPFWLDAQPIQPHEGLPTSEEYGQVLNVGGRMADELMKNLSGQLKGTLAQKGPLAAIDRCRILVPLIEKDAGESIEGVTVRRISNQVRNPRNRPDPIDSEAISALMQVDSDPEARNEPMVHFTDDWARYYEPIRIQPICLICHGDPASFSPELAASLKERYPQDEATGYQLGDLRGVIRVEIPRTLLEEFRLEK